MVLGTVVVGCEKNKLDENPTESRYEVSLRDSQNEITIILNLSFSISYTYNA